MASVPFPALAGMNRSNNETDSICSSVPRARGDEPMWTETHLTRLFPFPALAGMNRR